MNISEKMRSIKQASPPLAVSMLADLIEHATPIVSANGERRFIDDRYEGDESLNQLARLYYDKGNFKGGDSLAARLQHHSLLSNLQTVYRKSNDAVNASWAGYLTTLRETRPDCKACWGITEAKVFNKFHPPRSLLFSEQDFQQLWPGAKPETEVMFGVGCEYLYEASREMVESAIKNSLSIKQAENIEANIERVGLELLAASRDGHIDPSWYRYLLGVG